MCTTININTLPLPILVINIETNVVKTNKSYIDFFGNATVCIEDINNRCTIDIHKIQEFPVSTFFFNPPKGKEKKPYKITFNKESDKIITAIIEENKPDLELLFRDKQFLNLFLNFPLGIILKNQNTNETLYVSDYLASKIGYSTEEIIQKPWRYFTYKDDIPMQETIMNDSIHNGLNAFFFEKRLVTKSGRIYWFSEYVKVFEHNQKPYQIIMLRDISSEKEIETELNRAKHMVENAERLKSAFLDNMPHEIRTPLHAITGFTSLLSDADLGNEERLEYVKFIQDSSNDILNLMDNIIEIAKLETNQIKPKKEKCYINSIIDKAHSDIVSKQNILEKEHLKIKVSKGNLDPLFMIISDPERIYQILSHILNNALKFTDEGEIEFGYYSTRDKKIEFFVKDTGIGIDPKDKELIFQKFGKSGYINTNKNRGSGLGLTLSKKLVEILNGTIWLESEQGVGSTFKFQLPIEGDQKISITKPSITGGINWASKTILIAEDTESNYFFIEAFLERTKVNILWAKDGVEAVDMFRKNDINLVLMDIMMPEKDGYDATREIKAIDPKVPVIAQTALALPDDEEKCYNAGCDFVLVKPINSEDLVATIKRFIR